MYTGNSLTLQGLTHCISDLHLSENTPQISHLFQTYCEQHTHGLKNLIILGDFFEFYLGDDIISPYQHHIASMLQQLTHQGVQIYFMPGNRDFLVRQKFLDLFNGVLLKDPSVLVFNLLDQKYILTHGDQLCTRDQGYQVLRFFLRAPWIEALILKLPSSIRASAARYLRQQSRAKHYTPLSQGERRKEDKNLYAAHDPYDVTEPALQKLYRTTGLSHMIHGHTHKQAVHPKNNTLRWVLGDWHHTGNYLALSAPQAPEFLVVTGLEGAHRQSQS